MNLGWPEILLIVLVVFLLFGATRLPSAARSLGRSMRIFKSEMDEMKTDKNGKEVPAQQQSIEHQDPVQNQVQNFGQAPQQQPSQPEQGVAQPVQPQPLQGDVAQNPQQPGQQN